MYQICNGGNNNDVVKNSFDDTFSINLVKTNARNTNRMINPFDDSQNNAVVMFSKSGCDQKSKL